MWFILPQVAGLGYSSMLQTYPDLLTGRAHIAAEACISAPGKMRIFIRAGRPITAAVTRCAASSLTRT